MYTVKEVAEKLKLSVLTIRQYIRTGKLKADKKKKGMKFTYEISDEQLNELINNYLNK